MSPTFFQQSDMEQTIKDLLTAMLATLDVDVRGVNIKKEEKGDTLLVDIECEEPSRIIGWHGETLAAIQHILKSLVRSKENLARPPFILLDTDGYRSAQEDKVRRIAEEKVDFVRKTGNRVALRPMSPYYRRIVHTHIAATPALADVTTESIGEGDYRQVVLRLKDEHAHEGEELSPVMSETEDEKNVFENLDV